MSTVESLNAEIAQATQRFNDLRQQSAEAGLVDAAKKSLGELKKALATLNGAAPGGSKDAGKKKERMLLKTAKVSARSLLCCRKTLTGNHAGYP
jgi:histidyl-tRNA synthetase